MRPQASSLLRCSRGKPSTLYPFLFLILAGAVCLRLDNRRWSLFLIIPSHVLLIALTWLLIGRELFPLTLALSALSAAFLVLTAVDGWKSRAA